MPLHLRVFLGLALCASYFPTFVSAQIDLIVGAPFTATQTNYPAGESRPSIAQMARASDGSVYLGIYSHDNKLARVEIQDVPNHRRISFLVPPPNTYNHTYSQQPLDHTVQSIEEVRERLRRNEQHWADEPDSEKDNRRIHHTALGERSLEGMTLFGFHGEITREDGQKSVFEYWQSDLGLTMSSSTIHEDGEESYWTIINLRREEPDPSLFQIPKEYLSDPMLDANTIFIENMTGTQEVLDSAISKLNLWKKMKHVKPLTIVQEKNAADLTATLTRVPVSDLSPNDQASSTSGIKLQVFLRTSKEPVFEESVGSSGSARSDGFAAERCVTSLWNRLANTHVGLRQRSSAELKTASD
jgi:hypothetical protein